MDRYNFNDLNRNIGEVTCNTRIIKSVLHARCRWYLDPQCTPGYQLYYSVRCYTSPIFSTKHGDLVFRLLLLRDEASRSMILRPEFQTPYPRPKFCIMKGHVFRGQNEGKWCFNKMDDTMSLRFHGFLLEDEQCVSITCHLLMQLEISNEKHRFLEFYPRGYTERRSSGEILDLTFQWSVSGFSTRFPAIFRSMIFSSQRNQKVQWFLKLGITRWGKMSMFLRFLEPEEVTACFWEIFIVNGRKLSLLPIANERSWSRYFTREEWYTNLSNYRDKNGALNFMGRLIVACNSPPPKQLVQFEVQRGEKMKEVVEDLTRNCVDYGIALNQQRLPDLVLLVDDKAIPAHKIVLLSHSPIFFELLMIDFDVKQVKIEGVDHETMSLIVRYIYDGRIQVNYDRAALEKLLAATRSFRIESLKLALEEWYSKDMKVENVVETLQHSVKYREQDLREKALVFFNDNLENMELKQYEEVTELSTETMLALVLKKFEKNFFGL